MALKNFEEQLFPERQERKETLPYQLTSRDAINADAMLKGVSAHGLFSSADKNQGLNNFLTGLQATPEQQHDLLTFITK